MSSVLDKKDIATTVRDLAKKHQVAYVRTSLDDLADNITRLSGDDVAAPDEIQELLIALRRGRYISGAEFVGFQTVYLRQKNRGI